MFYFEPKVNIFLYKFLFVEHLNTIFLSNDKDNYANLDDLLGYINNSQTKSNQRTKAKIKKNNKKPTKPDLKKNQSLDITRSKTETSIISNNQNQEEMFLDEFKIKLESQSAPREYILKINNKSLINLIK